MRWQTRKFAVCHTISDSAGFSVNWIRPEVHESHPVVQQLRRLNHVPKKRIPTRPGAAAKRRRIEAKKQRGALKKARGRFGADE